MKTLNKVLLLGSVGKDPEMKSTPGGTLVANLSLATSENRKDAKGTWVSETTWHNLVAFGQTAEVVRDYVKKGSSIHIEGRIANRSWEKDGRKHYRSEIIVDSLILLGGKREEKGAESELEISDEDIPF